MRSMTMKELTVFKKKSEEHKDTTPQVINELSLFGIAVDPLRRSFNAVEPES